MTEEEFLNELHKKGNSGLNNNISRKLMLLYFDYIDNLHLMNKFDESNNLLLKIDLEKLSIVHLLGLLAITNAAKRNLSNRKEFFNKIKEIITKRDLNRVNILLKGLE